MFSSVPDPAYLTAGSMDQIIDGWLGPTSAAAQRTWKAAISRRLEAHGGKDDFVFNTSLGAFLLN